MLEAAARDLGRVVPDDLSVMGFDDVDMARQVSPALSTVWVEKKLMGILGVRCLIDRAENPDRPALTTLISTQLIRRGSVRALESDPARGLSVRLFSIEDRLDRRARRR